MQLSLDNKFATYIPPKSQLLKWVGNKQRFAGEIAKFFPVKFNTFYEPFIGSGAVIATVSPRNGVGSDAFKPLMDIWKKLQSNPNELIEWYAVRRNRLEKEDKKTVYEDIKASFNANHNGADFLYLTRSCYGGIIRFRKSDGYMSTPCGVHTPISVKTFSKRVKEWNLRLRNVAFLNIDYKDAFDMAKEGDLIYCDPPYSHSQSILYGAQDFKLSELFEKIKEAKNKGVKVALSIDGKKKSGNYLCDLPIPENVFEEEIFVSVGRSMLRRFQMEGQSLESELVSDRLLLNYSV
ncbi:DNA adenine methylase [Phaeodactylibacter xiamenensis]|jgi:DNA adenine methylase|uniref:Site-specific DNA-methyltransferase (adenine-specific) n=1 Tax=Phaeodactylibacter xiamenensis TaxID=1524460 RepID=A0A098RY56_9BACT|nr:Dam family site-specific DNA-(adenine-N6)-methyltransferase [Phaeodactylibacter xiamenensis]KGE84815.1 DNA methyltransferase [Phaeodactylibacter xiamenensis]